MIIYNPLDGFPIPQSIQSQAKHCFLMTRLGNPVPPMVEEMRAAIEVCCARFGYIVIDAQSRVTGRDILLKIWRQIASTPLSLGIIHEDIPQSTQANIFYELGVAQGLGKETVIVKSPNSKILSDLSRTEYVDFDDDFLTKFDAYLETIHEAANSYELMADQLEKNPVLALDLLNRAFLITGDEQLKKKAQLIVVNEGFKERAANSVELIAAAF